MCDSKVNFRVGTSEDKPKVAQFMKKFFWPGEPICKSENLVISDEINDEAVSILELGTCTIAEDEAGNLIGLRLAEPRVPEDVEKKKVENPQNTLDKLGKLVYDLAIGAKVFEKYNVDKAMYSSALVVDENLGYPIYVCDCTSAFSAKACANLGFTEIFEIVFKDYQDESGKPVLHPDSPHDRAVVYVKIL
uniref:N-acetyltransferase domain-containing protein n=1 Tax=Megaselia scalaris TaxID=36166 RepID=T1GRC5_MEGSC